MHKSNFILGNSCIGLIIRAKAQLSKIGKKPWSRNVCDLQIAISVCFKVPSNCHNFFNIKANGTKLCDVSEKVYENNLVRYFSVQAK